MILEKNVGYHHLTTHLIQPNPTLLDKITSNLTNVRGLHWPHWELKYSFLMLIHHYLPIRWMICCSVRWVVVFTRVICHLERVKTFDTGSRESKMIWENMRLMTNQRLFASVGVHAGDECEENVLSSELKGQAKVIFWQMLSESRRISNQKSHSRIQKCVGMCDVHYLWKDVHYTNLATGLQWLHCKPGALWYSINSNNPKPI